MYVCVVCICVRSMCMFICLLMCWSICVSSNVCIYVFVCMHVCVRVCVYVRACVCVCSISVLAWVYTCVQYVVSISRNLFHVSIYTLTISCFSLHTHADAHV